MISIQLTIMKRNSLFGTRANNLRATWPFQHVDDAMTRAVAANKQNMRSAELPLHGMRWRNLFGDSHAGPARVLCGTKRNEKH